jgi:hypothetical protein
MGDLVIKNGVAFGISSEALIIDMSAAKDMQPARPATLTKPYDNLNILPWSPWGSNNLLGAGDGLRY